jgi:hypothetical protein
MCDNCAAGGHIEEKTYTEVSKKLVEIVSFCEKDFKLKGNFILYNAALSHSVESATSNAVRDIFRGSKSKGLKKFEKCPNYGDGKEIKKEDCDRILEKLVSMDIIREAFNVSTMGMRPSRLPFYFSILNIPYLLGFTVTTLRVGPQSVPLMQSALSVVVVFRRGGKGTRYFHSAPIDIHF